jgi:3-oxoadipate enol-lactonase
LRFYFKIQYYPYFHIPHLMYKKGTDISIKIDDIIISYNDLGEGKLPILFIHGFPFDKSCWHLQADHLQSTHRVITYDIRGFGKSTINDEKISISLLADDLIKLMDALQIPKAIVCGLSMGGYILLNALDRYPKRFAAIILSDTQCVADTSEGREKRHKNIQLIESGGIAEYTEATIKNLFCAESFITRKEEIARIKNTMLSTSPKTLTETLNALAHRKDMCSMLDKITVPSLILAGKEDMSIPVKQSEFLHHQIPRSILYLIDKAGHLPNLEQPIEFNRLVKDFAMSMVVMHAEN